MAAAPNYYVISYDAAEALPFGVAWFDEIGRDIRGGSPFRFFASRGECIEHVGKHTRYTNPVLLDDESPA